jgi:TolB-like protein/Tfp pilus assembly protein PilF
MMLAVLPFENLTGDAAQEYFSDGLTEEMITQIGKLDPHYLGVIARTSVMHYKNTVTPLSQIGDELKVQYVLEGSVRRDPEKVRITAKLVKVADQSPAWTREYDRDLTDLLALERDIAHDIAAEIQLTLEEGRGAVAGMTPQAFHAYDAYLKGRYYWNKRTIEDLREAIRQFEESIAADPGEARAYAGLADCYLVLPGYEMAPQALYVSKARTAALKALELNENLAEAHTSLALLMVNDDWDWTAAEREYLQAIELNPNYATAHHWYAELLMWTGRFDEALHESERARLLDPLSLIIAADNGVILLFSRRYDLAEKKLASVLELEPNFPRAHMIRFVYTETGAFDKALADIARWSPRFHAVGLRLRARTSRAPRRRGGARWMPSRPTAKRGRSTRAREPSRTSDRITSMKRSRGSSGASPSAR